MPNAQWLDDERYHYYIESAGGIMIWGLYPKTMHQYCSFHLEQCYKSETGKTLSMNHEETLCRKSNDL